MAKQSRSKKAPRKARAAKTSPVKSPRKAAGKSAKAPKAARKAKAAPKAREPQKAAPRAAKATRKPKAPKAPRARKVRPPKPVEVYGHDAPYNCDDPFVKEPVRLRVCRPDPRKPSRRKCDVREFVVEGCATPGPGRRAKQMYVVPHTHQYLAPAREVARARVMPLPDNGDCADARFAHAHGRSIGEGAYGACNISESSEAGLTIDPASISFPNGYGRARGQMARGSRHNPPLLVPGRNYRWASPHGGSGVVTYLSGDGRTARVSLNGSVFGVPTRELLPMGADIGVGYPMTFPNGADAVGMGTSPTFLPPPKSDPHIGKRVFGKNVQGMVRGVARCGEKGPRQYVVGGQIVSRARVASSLKREKLMAEGNWPPPRRARSAPQVVPAPMPRRERAPEVMGPAWSPPPPRIMLPPPERIIEAQVVAERPARGRERVFFARGTGASGHPARHWFVPQSQEGDALRGVMVDWYAAAATPTDARVGVERTVQQRHGSDEIEPHESYWTEVSPADVPREVAERMKSAGVRFPPHTIAAAQRGKAKQTTMALDAPLLAPTSLSKGAKRDNALAVGDKAIFNAVGESRKIPVSVLMVFDHGDAIVVEARGNLKIEHQAPMFALTPVKGGRLEETVADALAMFSDGKTPSKAMQDAVAAAIRFGQFSRFFETGSNAARSAFEYITNETVPRQTQYVRDFFRGRPFPVVV